MSRDPRNTSRFRGDREPWQDPAPSFGYQSEGTREGGARETREPVRSRSADPGQSSYGGFSNEDPSFQRQQVYEGQERGRGSDGRHPDARDRYADQRRGTGGQSRLQGGRDRAYGRDQSYDGPTSFGDDEGGYYGDRPAWREESMSFETAERGGYNRGPTAWRDRASRRTDPKGYIRSDDRVRENVCEALAHSGLDVSDVSVSVTDGRVVLEGTVPDRRIKHHVEDCTVECAGVNDVDNRIRVAGASNSGASSNGPGSASGAAR
ncbi:BON domain-containing protein [Achromobacter mucicolens]|uniref:BON domain-containing protein n=1 Tax=Achromobacter mucicolens TaxID=1389922 RepID=UPI000D34E452|nr:BON domain-containing protein [Achromobacter mucicolens]PTX06759.1 BON domain-containing protein [Achromobacter mucicolens]